MQRQYATTYGTMHSKDDFRPQGALYAAFHGSRSNESGEEKQAALSAQRYFSTYDASFRTPQVAVSQSLLTRPTGFSRNSQSQVSASLDSAAADGGCTPISEYRQAFFANAAR